MIDARDKPFRSSPQNVMTALDFLRWGQRGGFNLDAPDSNSNEPGGRLAGMRDIVVFHGSSVDELETAFHESVDDYLAHCAKLGLPANKPICGRMLLRVPPEVHALAHASHA